MKTATDPRHRTRVDRVELLFAYSFQSQNKSPTIKPILDNLTLIDQTIATAAPSWPLDKINKIDLAILRQAVYELKYIPQTPKKVVIDESIEIAKSLGAESSPTFVNGVLGTIIKEL